MDGRLFPQRGTLFFLLTYPVPPETEHGELQIGSFPPRYSHPAGSRLPTSDVIDQGRIPDNPSCMI